MENTEEKALVVAENNGIELASDIFGNCKESDGTRKVTSIDINDQDQADMLLNAMQDVDFKLNECIDKEIVTVGFYAREKDVESFNEDTGETIIRKKHVLMLFDKDGKSYVTGSNACFSSFNDIVAIKGMPTKENPLTLKPIKVDAEEKGHSYLRLKVVTKK